MILDYYRIFYYVAQYKSFSKAADVMGNNQPNITRCMNILENELGCKLFIRSNRGVQLTIEGERLFEHVSIAIEQLVSGENELLKDKGLESGLVNIGASEIALRLFLLNELEVFHHRYPHVKLRISNHSTPQAVQALENGLVDFAVVTTPVALKKPLQRIPLYSFREILIGGEEYAETASNKHCLQDLQDIPLIGIAPGSSTRELYTQYFMRHTFPSHLIWKWQLLTRSSLWCSTTWESDSSLKSLLLNILLRGKSSRFPLKSLFLNERSV